MHIGAIGQAYARDVHALAAVDRNQFVLAAAHVDGLPFLIVIAVAAPLLDVRAVGKPCLVDIGAFAAMDRADLENTGADAAELPLLVGVVMAGPLLDVRAVGGTDS